MSRCEAPSPAPAPLLVFAEEAPPKTDTTSSEDILRKMIAEKISGAEVVVASMKSSIAEKERLIAEKERVIGENRATLSGSREEILNLQKQLAILDNMCVSRSSGDLVDAKVRVHEVVRAGDVATLTKRDVRRQIEAEFGLEFVANNKGAINRTIEEAASVNPEEAKVQDAQWSLEDLGSGVEIPISKKVLLGWLKDNASAELLEQFGLSGTFKQIMKKRTRPEVVKAYLAAAGGFDRCPS